MEVENTSHAALLLIDVINDFDFDGGEKLLEQLAPAAQRIKHLCAEARAARVPIIYVNDNFGLWRSERDAIVKHCLREGSPGRAIVESLAPREDDYFVVKPRHSGFFATNLPVLLPDLRAQRLIMVGVAADICVLFTANDAYMRDYRLWVPRDCVASSDTDRRDRAIDHMEKVLKSETRPAAALRISDWLKDTKVSDRFVRES